MPKVTLRPVRDTDSAIHHGYPPDPDFVRMYGGDPNNLRTPSLEHSKGWVSWLRDHRFGRIILADGAPVGEIRLHSFDDTNASAMLAIGLFSPDHINQGIGRQAIKLTCAAGRDTFKLTQIKLRVLAFNTRAIRCYQACGFAHSATQTVTILNQDHDEWTMTHRLVSSE